MSIKYLVAVDPARDKAEREYGHRLETGSSSEFLTGQNVIDSLVEKRELVDADFQEKEWEDNLHAFETEINYSNVFGCVNVNSFVGENEKIPRSFSQSFSEERPNNVVGETFTRDEVIDVECIETIDEPLEIKVSLPAPGKTLEINPEKVFGAVIYGTPPMEEAFGEEMREDLHPEFEDYLEEGVPGPSLGRVRAYVEGNTCILGIGYQPAEVDEEVYQNL